MGFLTVAKNIGQKDYKLIRGRMSGYSKLKGSKAAAGDEGTPKQDGNSGSDVDPDMAMKEVRKPEAVNREAAGPTWTPTGR